MSALCAFLCSGNFNLELRNGACTILTFAGTYFPSTVDMSAIVFAFRYNLHLLIPSQAQSGVWDRTTSIMTLSSVLCIVGFQTDRTTTWILFSTRCLCTLIIHPIGKYRISMACSKIGILTPANNCSHESCIFNNCPTLSFNLIDPISSFNFSYKNTTLILCHSIPPNRLGPNCPWESVTITCHRQAWAEYFLLYLLEVVRSESNYWSRIAKFCHPN